MDGSTFDRLARTLTTSRSRRHALGAGLAGALGLIGAGAEHAAGKKKKSKPCPPCKKRKKGKCKANLPDGAGCDGGTCQGGSCVAQPVADARCPGPPNDDSFTASSNYRFGQTFTARQTGKLVRAEVLANKNTAENADWIVQIVDADVEGRPSETVLAEARIANATLADGQVMLRAAFATPPTVTVNREYAVVLAWGGAENFDFPLLTGNPCGGRLHAQDQSGSAPYNSMGSPYDLVYTTFVLA